MSWHWDAYVDKNNLWYHFGRFTEAIKGINPLEEKFVTSKSESDDFRIYQLRGEKTILIWIRDKTNTWETELRDGQQPLTRSGITFDLKQTGMNRSPEELAIYDPWKDKWQDAKNDGLELLLPGFKRSLVIRIRL